MFTGIIADVGKLASLQRHAQGARARIETRLDLGQVALGDSVAVNGCCLTAVAFGKGSFEADLSPETLSRTTFGTARAGQAVNLELALRVGDRLGGHMVQGHVDGVGRFVQRERAGDGWELTFEIPAELMDSVIDKGSIALDGVSLTIARLAEPRVTIAVVPHTAAHTTLGALPVGAPVNVETDVIGKYVARSLGRLGGGGGLTLEKLAKHGFT